jgi:aminopeptidase
MQDSRINKWADVLVNYSLAAQKGQSVLILGDLEAIPLLTAVYRACILAGLKVETILEPSSWTEFLLQHGSDEQIAFTPYGKLCAVQNHDLYIRISATSNSKMLSQIPSQKLSHSLASSKPILETMLHRAAEKHLRWCYTAFPTPASAQDAEMGTDQFSEWVLDACYLNEPSPSDAWKKMEEQQDQIIQFLEGKKELHFQNWQGTDLRVNVEGMKWVNCCGTINFPDGEIYTGPNAHAVDGGVNGIVRYSLPTVFRNIEVHDIELTFKQGKVIKASASKNEEYLQKMIAFDEGSQYVGEIAIGTNEKIQTCTKNILFDEKIGGTFHLALGMGYPQTGNTNKSALHWDMIFDMRKGGTIHADGELFHQDGRFVPPRKT